MRSNEGENPGSRRRPPPGPLLCASARAACAWLLAGCAALTAVVGVLVARQSHPWWIDRAVDSRLQQALAADDRLLRLGVDLAEPTQIAVLAAALIAWCLISGRLRAAVLAAVSVPLTIAATELVLKPLVGRTLHGALVYPSGHSSRAFALAAVLTVVLLGNARPPLPFAARLGLALVALLAACAVAIAMIGLDYHYFSDTVAGAAVGAGTVLGVALLLDWSRSDRALVTAGTEQVSRD